MGRATQTNVFYTTVFITWFGFGEASSHGGPGVKPGDPMRGKPRWVLAGLGRSDAQGGSLDLDKIEAALQRGCLGLSGPHGHLRDQRLYIINSLREDNI